MQYFFHELGRTIRTTLVFIAILVPARGNAESDLTLYGTVDMGISCTRVSDEGRRCGLLGGGQTDSLWGLQGRQGLGSSGYARFVLEGGINMAEGHADDLQRLFNLQSWLGLGHADWGEWRLGRQATVGEDFFADIEVGGWRDFGMGALMRAADSHPVSEQISWRSPPWDALWAGFQVGASYSFDVRDPGATGPRTQLYSLAARYEHGPWLAAVSVERMQRLALAALPELAGRRPQAWQLGVSYDLGLARVALAWSRQRNGFVGRNGDDGPDALADHGLQGLGPAEFIDGGRLDVVYLGLAVPVGPGEWQLQGSQGRPRWVWQDEGQKGGQPARRSQTVSLAYLYPLSPRTSLYAFAARGRRYAMDAAISATEPRTRRLAVGLTHHF